jgi:hypothetical protein
MRREGNQRASVQQDVRFLEDLELSLRTEGGRGDALMYV